MDACSMDFPVFPENAKVRFDCAGASGLRFRPLRLPLWASISVFLVEVLGSPWGAGFERSAPEAPPGRVYQGSFRKFIYEPCSLRFGPSPYSLKGAFGEPAAGSIIYVAFGAHPATGKCVCVCSSKLMVLLLGCFFVRLSNFFVQQRRELKPRAMDPSSLTGGGVPAETVHGR